MEQSKIADAVKQQFQENLANQLFTRWGKLLGQYMMQVETLEFEKKQQATQIQELKEEIKIIKNNSLSLWKSFRLCKMQDVTKRDPCGKIKDVTHDHNNTSHS